MSLVLMNATVKYSTTTTTITKWKHDIKGNKRLISSIIIIIIVVVIICSSLFLSCIVILFLGCVRLFVFAEYLCQFSSRSSRRVFDHFPAVRVRDDVRSVCLSVCPSILTTSSLIVSLFIGSFFFVILLHCTDSAILIMVFFKKFVCTR